MNFQNIMDEAVEIAESASLLAVSYFRQAVLIELKQDQTPVTIADKKTEEKIRAELKESFPDYGIIGEEFGAENPDAEFVWTVDPIDGTRSFVRGIPLFGTLLGLLQNNQPVVGVMVLPMLSETYFAAKDLGAFCNGTQVHVSPTNSLEAAFISCGDKNCFEMSGMRHFEKKIADRAELVRGYTDCFAHSLVIRGAMDAMVDPLVSIWDVVPIACLIREAGGEYFSFDGETTHTGKSFITCTSELREPLLQLV